MAGDPDWRAASEPPRRMADAACGAPGERRRHAAPAAWALAALAVLLSFATGAAAAPPDGAETDSLEYLRHLSLEDLANLEVTSVFGRPEPLSQAPASIYVITREDIRRSGAVSLPEALRLAPNLDVTRRSNETYAIAARGFNSFESSNKMLVLIDGRSIYTTLHGGVFWDQQQVMLEDVERIEVISGPGGTLWGANAFNGVVNVITRSSAETQGGLASAALGNTGGRGGVRYGGRLGESGSYRVYGMGFDERSSERANGTSAIDAWGNRQGGFRTDWALDRNTLTLQGDWYENPLDIGGENKGHNLLGRWARRLGEDESFQVQGYYDATDRSSIGVTDRQETFDVQAQHHMRMGAHEIVWGGGYRHTEDEFVNTLNAFVLDEPKGTVDLANLFVQDTIALRPDLALTLGTKFEHSSYSGFEYLPNVRLAWQASPTAMVWGAVSRSVRTPARFDRSLQASGTLVAARGFQSEEVIAYEVGYRGRPTPQSSISVSLYYNDYDDLRVLAVAPGTSLLRFDNKMRGQTYGIEAWGDYRVADWWRLSAGVNVMQKNLELERGAVTTAIQQHQGNDPDYRYSLRSRFDLSRDLQFDVGLRLVDDLPNPVVPGYLELEARLGWQVDDRLELYVTGFNLLDEGHAETGAAATRSVWGRTIFVGTRFGF